MKNSQRQDLRPIIYIVSPSADQIKIMVAAAINLEYIPLAYESFDSFFPNYDETTPGCVVLCLEQHDVNTSKMIDRIVKRDASALVILVTRNWALVDIINAIKQGATNVVAEPIECLRMVDALSEAISSDRSKRTGLKLIIPDTLLALLRADEASIFSLLIQGRTTKEIGSELDVSVRTIHYRKSSIFKKLGVRDRSEAFELLRKIRYDEPMYDVSGKTYPSVQNKEFSFSESLSQ